jgi:hypothetical protein
VEQQQASILKTLEIPTTGGDPALLHQSGTHVVRVVIRNVGGNLIFLAHSVNELQNSVAPSEVFQLAAGTELIIVLMPGQQVLAAGQGAGGQASVAVSVALPKEWMSS